MKVPKLLTINNNGTAQIRVRYNNRTRSGDDNKPQWEVLRDRLEAKAAQSKWYLTPEIIHHRGNGNNMAYSGEVVVLSEAAPRVVLFRDFLSQQECSHLMSEAEAGLERSEVMDGDDHNAQKVRTSSGAWLDDLQDDQLFDINRRIQNATGVPWIFGENTHVLRYEPGQKYEAHVDSCFMEDFQGHDLSQHMSPDDAVDQQPQRMSAGCKEFLEQAGGPSCGFSGKGGVTCGDRQANSHHHAEMMSIVEWALVPMPSKAHQGRVR